jgi:NMD protein affecting ribosome stability and mRNA decay
LKEANKLSTSNKNPTACNGTIVVDTEMGEVIQLQGDQRKDVQEFLTDKKEGLELDAKTIKVGDFDLLVKHDLTLPPYTGPWLLSPSSPAPPVII